MKFLRNEASFNYNVPIVKTGIVSRREGERRRGKRGEKGEERRGGMERRGEGRERERGEERGARGGQGRVDITDIFFSSVTSQAFNYLLKGGLVAPLYGDHTRICDRFFLGGVGTSLSLRGFKMKGIDTGNASMSLPLPLPLPLPLSPCK